MGIQFEQPLVLALLPPSLLFVYVVWHARRVYLPPARSSVALALRLACVALVVLALAGPLLQLSANQIALAVLLDRSESITPGAQAQEEQWLTTALEAKHADDQVAVVSFAGDARVDRPVSADASPPTISSARSEERGVG